MPYTTLHAYIAIDRPSEAPSRFDWHRTPRSGGSIQVVAAECLALGYPLAGATGSPDNRAPDPKRQAARMNSSLHADLSMHSASRTKV